MTKRKATMTKTKVRNTIQNVVNLADKNSCEWSAEINDQVYITGRGSKWRMTAPTMKDFRKIKKALGIGLNHWVTGCDRIEIRPQ